METIVLTRITLHEKQPQANALYSDITNQINMRRIQ